MYYSSELIINYHNIVCIDTYNDKNIVAQKLKFNTRVHMYLIQLSHVIIYQQLIITYIVHILHNFKREFNALFFIFVRHSYI